MRTRTATENMIKIDGEKLYEQFNERGFTITKICKDVGVNSGYFSNAKYRGTIANMMVVLLESRYGIPRDSYVIKDVKEEVETTAVEVVTDSFSEENQKKLYKIVYSAVYEAMRRALSE